MSNPTKHLDDHVKALREAGYSVSPPREDQLEWELHVASIAEQFHFSVKKPYERGGIEIPGLSRGTLERLRAAINEVLGE